MNFSNCEFIVTYKIPFQVFFYRELKGFFSIFSTKPLALFYIKVVPLKKDVKSVTSLLPGYICLHFSRMHTAVDVISSVPERYYFIHGALLHFFLHRKVGWCIF